MTRQPISTTTTDDDLILRFLAATERRVAGHNGRVPVNSQAARMAINWMRGLVGKLNEDGSVGERS